MKLIVGLGNPGKKYANNRHNLGFMVVDGFATNGGLTWRIARDLFCHFDKTAEYVLAKPATFMNQSGNAVKAVADFYKIKPSDSLIIHDDLDLPFGKIRLIFGGASAGHKGVESVIASLGTADFCRLRIGISRPSSETTDGKSSDPEKYVLEDFSNEEHQKLDQIIKRCQEAIKSYFESGIEATMNRFN